MSYVANGVTFDGVHSYSNLGLWLSGRPDFGSPDPKLNKVDVPGADGDIDLTEANSGEVKFANRTMIITFAAMVDIANQATFRATVSNALHGKRFDRIIFDEDPGWFYAGRAKVRFIDVRPWKIKVIVTIDAFPYALKTTESGITLTQNNGVYYLSVNGGTATEISSDMAKEYIGADKSAQNWNTDIRIGTKDFPEGIARADAWPDLILEYPNNAVVGSWAKFIQVIDSDGNVFQSSISWPRPGAQSNTIRFAMSDITTAGVTPSKVYRVLVSGIGGCKIYREMLSFSVNIQNNRKNVIPVITLTADEPATIYVNGGQFTFNSGGPWQDDNLILHEGNNQFMLPLNTQVNVTAFSLKFREGKL